MVMELQFREILAPILLTVDRFWDLTDHLLLNIVWNIHSMILTFKILNLKKKSLVFTIQ